MSILTDRAPDHVEVGGVLHPINTDFRAGIRFELAILSEKANTEELLHLYYPKGLPYDLNEAVGRVLWFYQCGDREPGDGKGAVKSGQAYDFEQDADAIYSSFMVAYGIDLSTAALHWWVFRKLLFGLPPETPFMQRIHYRTADTAGLPKELKKHHEKMKAQYALKSRSGKRETLEERNQRMRDYVAKRFSDTEKA